MEIKMTLQLIMRFTNLKYLLGLFKISGSVDARLNSDLLTNRSLGLVGSNGAGKSTVLSHFTYLSTPISHDGSIVLNLNNKLLSISQGKSRGLIIPSYYEYFLELQLMPEPAEDIAHIQGLVMSIYRLHSFSMTAFLNHLNHFTSNNSTYYSENYHLHHLSRGQLKKVSESIILSLSEERLLILDEPTNYLDSKSKVYYMQELMSRASIKLISTHEANLIARCDDLLLLSKQSTHNSSAYYLPNTAINNLYMYSFTKTIATMGLFLLYTERTHEGINYSYYLSKEIQEEHRASLIDESYRKKLIIIRGITEFELTFIDLIDTCLS